MRASSKGGLAPALALGGFGSIWAVKGLYATQDLLQHTMQIGIETIGHFWGDPDAGVDLVIAEMRGPKRSANDMFLMQRKGASSGCMLLTTTGIFYIQPGDLSVFKASPWSYSPAEQTLDAYQQQIVQLGPKARALYDSAVAQKDTKLLRNQGEFSAECGNLLLHMLLSDIRQLTSIIGGAPLPAGVADCALLLIEKTMTPTVTTSTQAVTEWLNAAKELTRAWKTCMQDMGLFCAPRNNNNGADGATTIGLQRWKTDSPSVDAVFRVFFELKVEAPTLSPLIDRRGGKWAQLGTVRYVFV